MTFDVLLATLFTAFRKDLDEASATLYERGLADIPLPLLEAAASRAIQTRVFLPVIAEIRKDAEACRTEYLTKHPHEKCNVCKDLGGWVKILDEAGIERLARCRCFAAYRAGLAAIGIEERPVFLLSEAEPT